MRQFIPIAALALAGCAAADAQQQSERAARDEAGLAKELAGLTPGKATSCIPPRLPSTSLKAYGPMLVYSVSRSLKYVNRTTGGCEAVARGDILITRSFQSGPCRGDIAQTRTPFGGGAAFTGSCGLGDFVPYRAAK